MKLEDVQSMRLGNKEIQEVRLGDKVVWPFDVVSYEAYAIRTYYNTNNNDYILANGNGYAVLSIGLIKKVNGVEQSRTFHKATSVVFYNGSSQGSGVNQNWTITYTSGEYRISVGSRNNNEDSFNTFKEFNISATINGTAYSFQYLPIYQQQNVKTLGTKQTTLAENSLVASSNRYATTTAACAASGSFLDATISCNITYIDSTPYSFTSGVQGVESANRTESLAASQYSLSKNSEYDNITISGRSCTILSLGTNPTQGVSAYGVRVTTSSYLGTPQSKIVYLYQVQNKVDSTTYSGATISISATKYTSSSSPCPAYGDSIGITAGGTVNRIDTYTSLAQKTTSTNFDVNVVSSNTSWLTYDDGVAYISDRTNVTGGARNARLTASSADSNITATSKNVTIYQQQNAITGSTTTYDLSGNFTAAAYGEPKRAAGGSASANYWSVSAVTVMELTTRTFTSLYEEAPIETNRGNATIGVSTAGLNVSGSKVWWSSMGITIYNSGRSGHIQAKYGNEIIALIEVTQNRNILESTLYSDHIFKINGWEANFSVNHEEQWLGYESTEKATPVYSSGEYGTVTTREITPTASGSGFSVNGDLIHINANAGQSNRNGVIRSVGMSDTKAITITQTYIAKYARFGATTYNVAYNASTVNVSVESNINWLLTVPAVSFVSGNTSGSGDRSDIPLNLSTNYGESREAVITVKGTGSDSNIGGTARIIQAGYTLQWVGSMGHLSYSVELGAEASELITMIGYRVVATPTLSFDPGSDTSWFTNLSALPTGGGNKQLRIRVTKDNLTGIKRSATLRIKVSEQPDMTIILTQNTL